MTWVTILASNWRVGCYHSPLLMPMDTGMERSVHLVENVELGFSLPAHWAKVLHLSWALSVLHCMAGGWAIVNSHFPLSDEIPACHSSSFQLHQSVCFILGLPLPLLLSTTHLEIKFSILSVLVTCQKKTTFLPLTICSIVSFVLFAVHGIILILHNHIFSDSPAHHDILQCWLYMGFCQSITCS